MKQLKMNGIKNLDFVRKSINLVDPLTTSFGNHVNYNIKKGRIYAYKQKLISDNDKNPT